MKNMFIFVLNLLFKWMLNKSEPCKRKEIQRNKSDDNLQRYWKGEGKVNGKKVNQRLIFPKITLVSRLLLQRKRNFCFYFFQEIYHDSIFVKMNQHMIDLYMLGIHLNLSGN